MEKANTLPSTRQQLESKRKTLFQLEEQVRKLKDEIALLEEKDKLETRILSDQKALELLNEPPAKKAERAAKKRKLDDEERERQRKERESLPPYWPLPGPGMSREAANEWLSDRGL